MERLFNKRGQAILEYVIVLTAIVTAIIAATPMIREKIQDYLEHAITEMHAYVVTKLEF